MDEKALLIGYKNYIIKLNNEIRAILKSNKLTEELRKYLLADDEFKSYTDKAIKQMLADKDNMLEVLTDYAYDKLYEMLKKDYKQDKMVVDHVAKCSFGAYASKQSSTFVLLPDAQIVNYLTITRETVGKYYKALTSQSRNLEADLKSGELIELNDVAGNEKTDLANFADQLAISLRNCYAEQTKPIYTTKQVPSNSGYKKGKMVDVKEYIDQCKALANKYNKAKTRFLRDPACNKNVVEIIKPTTKIKDLVLKLLAEDTSAFIEDIYNFVKQAKNNNCLPAFSNAIGISEQLLSNLDENLKMLSNNNVYIVKGGKFTLKNNKIDLNRYFDTNNDAKVACRQLQKFFEQVMTPLASVNTGFSYKPLMAKLARINNFAETGVWANEDEEAFYCPDCGFEVEAGMLHCPECDYELD